jgi:hypothetical protein
MGLGWLLYHHIPRDDARGFARWLACMFGLGVLESVRQSLVDLPAMLLLAFSVTRYERNQFAGSAWCGALAALTKETGLLAVTALYSGDLRRPLGWRRIGVGVLAGLLPILLWSAYVHHRYGGLSAEPSPGNFTWPLAGMLTQIRNSLQELSAGNFDSRFSFGLIGIAGLITQAGFFWRYPRPASAWWRIGFVYSLLLVFLGSWVWSGYWAAFRAVLPMTVAFNLLLPGDRSFWPWWIAGNLTIIHAVWRFL